MAKDSNLAAQPPVETEYLNKLRDTVTGITSSLAKLFVIYRSHIPKLIPTELLQYSHGLELATKIITSPKFDNMRSITIGGELNEALNLAYFEFLEQMQQQPELDADSEVDITKVYGSKPWFKFLCSSYEIVCDYTIRWFDEMYEIDDKSKEQAHFYIKNILGLYSPKNNICYNPEIMQATLESRGLNLLQGYRHYLDDLVENQGQLNVRMTDLRAFAVGKNIAITPGKVVMRNELIEVIQYSPATDSVYSEPLLIIPPFINKYYVLDLSPKNSLVKWLVEQGHTVFMISWVNPDEKHKDKDFADYMKLGPLAAIDFISKTLNYPKINLMGYCIGGTLLACTLAYMQQHNDNRANSATFLMSLLDFSDLGEIGAFIDGPQLKALDKLMSCYGYLNGRLLDMTFNLLRPGDLIWPYFINHYLLGKETRPFDILYWNADSANLPHKMYSYYLQQMCLENKLITPGAIRLDGTPINLSKIKVPCFFLAAEADHITLWPTIYDGLKYLDAPVEFVVTQSGHVRGVLNPPGDTKYNCKHNPNFKHSSDYSAGSEQWTADAIDIKGSWWPEFNTWITKHCSGKTASKPIDKSKAIMDAPGSYVLKRI